MLHEISQDVALQQLFFAWNQLVKDFTETHLITFDRNHCRDLAGHQSTDFASVSGRDLSLEAAKGFSLESVVAGVVPNPDGLSQRFLSGIC